MAREMTRAELLAIDTVKPCDEAKRKKLLGDFKWEKTGNGDAIRILGGWDTKNIVTIDCPQLTRIGNKVSGRVTLHKAIAPQFRRFFELVEQLGLLGRVITWDGAFNPRLIRNSNTTRSSHAWGGAFDINAGWNGYGDTPAAAGARGSVRELVGIAEACGFGWGGWWSGKYTDGMHFELFDLVTAARLPVLVNQMTEPTVNDDPDVAVWAKPAVDQVIAEGIMAGYPDGSFRGANPISRQELAVVIARALNPELRVKPAARAKKGQ